MKTITERKTTMKRLTLGVLILAMLLLLAVGSSFAAPVDVYLYTGTTTKVMPDGAVVTLWGFALEPDQDFTTLDGTVEVPGPRISALAGDDLTIHLHNTLPEPVSIVVNGQVTTMIPTWTDGTTGARGGDLTKRVRSFTHEAAASGGEATYSWTGVKAGTYLYQSGTHPAVQVQMGLYGALTIDTTANNVYGGPSSTYTNEAILLYSEIDPVIANAVTSGTYGTPGNPTSTIDYAPKYFLVNGMPFPGGGPLPAGNAGQGLLLRFLNAGLMTHVPALENAGYMDVIAEDGNLYPYMKSQYSVFLPAGKTADAILNPASSGYIPVYDRRLFLANNLMPSGGMLSYLDVGAGGGGTTWTLTVNKAGAGTGTVTSGAPGGISCGADCTEDYNDGTNVSLSATPNPGSTFLGWSGDCTGTGACSVAMTAVRNVTATFAAMSHLGVYRSGSWYLDTNGTPGWQGGASDTLVSFGISTDLPVTGDWNDDGTTDIGVYQNGWWYLDTNGNKVWDGALTDTLVNFGLATDKPITGDWNGDGTTDIGVYRNGWWYLDTNGNKVWDGALTDTLVSFGISTDKPVTGDWNGDGTTDIGVYRNGWWYLDTNGNKVWDGALTDTLVRFGISTDTPVTGDWNSDGTTDIGVYRGNGWWYLDTNGNKVWDGALTDTLVRFGISTDTPVTGAW